MGGARLWTELHFGGRRPGDRVFCGAVPVAAALFALAAALAAAAISVAAIAVAAAAAAVAAATAAVAAAAVLVVVAVCPSVRPSFLPSSSSS